MSISEKSAIFIEIRRLMWVHCMLCDRGFDFWQRQGFYPSLSSPDRSSSTAHHVVTMSVNIYFTFMWCLTYLRRKELGSFNTCSLSWKLPDIRIFVKNISLVNKSQTLPNSGLYRACAFCSHVRGCTDRSSKTLEGSGLRAEDYYSYTRQMAVLYSLLRTLAAFSVPDR
jgi:hypothetical protein